MCPFFWQTSIEYSARAGSHCIVLTQKHGGATFFHSECTNQIYLWGKRIVTYLELQVCQMDFLNHGSCWQGAPQSAGFPSVIKYTVSLLMLWGSFKFRGVLAPAHVWKLPSQNHEKLQHRKQLGALPSQCVPHCTLFPSWRMLSPVQHLKHP